MQLQYRTRVWYYWLHWDTMASFKLSDYFSSGCFQTFEHSFCLIEIAVRCSKKKENMCYSHSTSLITSNKIICRLICLLISLSGHNATQYELFGSGLIIRFFSWGAHDEMWMWRASGSPVKFCLLIACCYLAHSNRLYHFESDGQLINGARRTQRKRDQRRWADMHKDGVDSTDCKASSSMCWVAIKVYQTPLYSSSGFH